MTRNKPATKINMDGLEKDIERHPDDYQWEPGKRLGVTQSAIHYALQRLGVSYKKTLQHPKTNQQAGNPIVYLDESGCQAEFLPPASPDLNPIEHKWAQAKAVRRRYRCGIDELFSEHSQYVVL